MPCSSEGYGDSYRSAANDATRAACDLVRVARATGMWGKVAARVSAQTLAWVERHDEIDAEREKEEKHKAVEEAARKAALKKLSKKERDLLGIR